MHSVILGIRRTGKTMFFTGLARAEPSVFYWDAAQVARLATAAEVWRQMFGLFGRAFDDLEDPQRQLHAYLDTCTSTVTLVVDGWDQAVDRDEMRLSDASYEVLDSIARFCLDQVGVRKPSAARLGLALISSLPDVSDLEVFARRVQRATFQRLSTLVTRSFHQARFPFAGDPVAAEYLEQQGVIAARVPGIVAIAGGWFWLLEELAKASKISDADALVARDYRAAVMKIVDAAVLTPIGNRSIVRETGISAIEYIEQELVSGKRPATLGLPADPADPTKLAPAIRSTLARTRVFVDIEHVRMLHLKEFKQQPELYPDGVDAYLQDRAGAWVRGIAEEHGITDEESICFVGVTRQRIDLTIGPGTPGRRAYLPRSRRDKGRAREGRDDVLLATEVAAGAAARPLGDIVLLTGDSDIPVALGLTGVTNRVIVYAPWDASAPLREALGQGTELRENTFPGRRPVARNADGRE